MPSRSLPSRTPHEQSDLDQLKQQAKALLEAFRTTPDAVMCIAVDGAKFLMGTNKHKGIVSREK